jgi:molecular chaperone GrpE (heat shock protein)
VVRELQRGYVLHDRLLRPAIVEVAVPAEEAAEESPE